MTIDWTCKEFGALTPYEVYALLRLRSEVFVVEQNCIFLDPDNLDQQCFHLLGYSESNLIVYARIVPPGVIYIEPSIGRVVTSSLVRRTGGGKLVMQQAIERLYALFGKATIKIGAQLYLKKFYESFEFNQISDVYLEDGIEHIYMLKKLTS